jgi:uncharacterized membrane protein
MSLLSKIELRNLRQKLRLLAELSLITFLFMFFLLAIVIPPLKRVVKGEVNFVKGKWQLFFYIHCILIDIQTVNAEI